jgi:hypothetical protein
MVEIWKKRIGVREGEKKKEEDSSSNDGRVRVGPLG